MQIFCNISHLNYNLLENIVHFIDKPAQMWYFIHIDEMRTAQSGQFAFVVFMEK